MLYITTDKRVKKINDVESLMRLKSKFEDFN